MEAASINMDSFPPISRSQWLKVVRELEAAKKDGSSLLDKVPSNISYADPHFEQLHQDYDLQGLGHRAVPNWTFVQRIDNTDAKRANVQAQEDIEAGTKGLAIVFDGAPNSFGHGLPARPEALAAALHNIPLNLIYLRIDVHPSSRATVDWMVEIVRRKKIDPGHLNLSFGIDPAAVFAGNGSLRMSIEALHASMPQSLAHFFAMSIPAVLLEADGRVVHNAGATETQELAVMLAGAVSHLRMFQEARQPLIYAVPHIGFALCVDQDQILSIAKIHALRRLWAQVQESCGITPTTAKVHVETSYRMLTARDLQINIMRNTLAAFSAAAGGADTISILPHTMPCGLPDGEARYLARNTQFMLSDETHLNALASPMAGSRDLELLTASLCAGAWEEFRRIETEGGLLNSLAAGHIQTRVKEARQNKVAARQNSALNIAGTTVPKDKEDASNMLEATTHRREPPRDGVVFCEPLPYLRLDENLIAALPEENNTDQD